MNIELKKLSISLAHSEETILFTADVHINGKKALYAKNDGRGGNTFYHSYEGCESLMAATEQYCKSLPRVETDGFSYSMDLEAFIDNLVDVKVKEKEAAANQKRVDKACLFGIVYGIPNSGDIKTIGWKSPLSEVLKHPQGVAVVQRAYAKIKDELVGGVVIFNTNLPKEIFGSVEI